MIPAQTSPRKGGKSPVGRASTPARDVHVPPEPDRDVRRGPGGPPHKSFVCSVLAALLLLCAATAWAQSLPYQLKVSTDRTAVWVGDRLEYVIRVEHDSSVEFVRDHLAKEEMNVQPFELREVRVSSGAMAQGKRFFEVHLDLALYESGKAEVSIPALRLFFFRTGPAPTPGRAKEETPAEILTVPPFAVGVRSTLVDPGTSIRDQKGVLPIRRLAWIVPSVLGALGFLVLAVWAAWAAAAQVRSGFWKKKLAERARKKSLSETLDEIRQQPAESPQELEAFYKKASELLRAMAAEKLHDGIGLTGKETEAALKKAGAHESQAVTLGELLDQCDLVRYAPDGLDQGRRMRPDFLRRFAELTEHRP